jgi:hypothetical protein
MWIGKYVTGDVQDQFEVLCGLYQMVDEDVITWYEVDSTLEEMWKNAVMA